MENDDDEDMPIIEGESYEKEEDLKDAIMAITANGQLSEWLVNGCIAGINSKEEEEEMIVKNGLSNYCPGIETHATEIYSPPRVTTMAERFRLMPGLALDLTTLDPDDQLP